MSAVSPLIAPDNTVEPGVFRAREDRFQEPRVRIYGGMGLTIMMQRAKLIGASFDIRRIGDNGTMVSCCLPHPSSLALPVLPGATAPVGLAACGSVIRQPCRPA